MWAQSQLLWGQEPSLCVGPNLGQSWVVGGVGCLDPNLIGGGCCFQSLQRSLMWACSQPLWQP